MKTFLYIFLGGGLGSVLRYWLSSVSGRLFSLGLFPMGTFLVNILGCFLIGMLSSYFIKEDHPLKFLLITGFCGGFTTFSAFSAENYSLWQGQHYGVLAGYILLSVLLGVLAVLTGFWVMKS